MDKRKIRDFLRLIGTILFFWIYIPHLVIYAIGGRRLLIDSDLNAIEKQINIKLPKLLQLLYHLHTNRYWRNIFYHRIGPVKALLLQWYRPGDRYFIIGNTVRIGRRFWIAHPYSTILAADSIGDNFRCIHLTTLGNTPEGRPTIGNNVALGANVTIIGPVMVGNNVTIGAGTVIVKDVPDDCVVVGNPARIIRRNGEKVNILL